MGFATYGQDQIPDDRAAEKINIVMTRGSAKHFVDTLIEAAVSGKPDRDWLLWGVGLIAQAYGADPEGPDNV